jgi:tRNA-splicing ligase RtcB (3'-phosphate/5'-hydroxy nucleic acid ligase)
MLASKTCLNLLSPCLQGVGAHGCGRLMTRSEARRSISLKNFKKSMKDVVSSSINKETLDEAPQAYKDYNTIIEAIEGNSVNVNKILKPIINWKG